MTSGESQVSSPLVSLLTDITGWKRQRNSTPRLDPGLDREADKSVPQHTRKYLFLCSFPAKMSRPFLVVSDASIMICQNYKVAFEWVLFDDLICSLRNSCVGGGERRLD